jgi:hypothetical protein
MQQAERLLDTDPSQAGRMVALTQRNRLAFVELDNYNKHKAFLFKHPYTIRYEQLDALDSLRRSDPETYMKQLYAAERRRDNYKSQIKNKHYKDEAQLSDWTNKLDETIKLIDKMHKLIAQ